MIQLVYSGFLPEEYCLIIYSSSLVKHKERSYYFEVMCEK